MRLNNTRQALLLLLLLPYFCPPSTSSCPQPQISTGFILQPTLSLPSPPFLPICLTLSPRMHIISRPPQGPLGSPVPLPGGLNLIFHDSFCKPVPYMSSLFFFCFFLFFALRCCIICCQVRLPVFVTHICKSFI